MVAIIDHRHGVCRSGGAQGVEEARRVDPALAVMVVPGLAISRLVSGNTGVQGCIGSFSGHRLAQGLQDLGHYHTRIAFDGDLRRVVGVEHLVLDVDMDQLLGDLGAKAAGGNLTKARANRQHHIAVGKGVLGGGHGVRTKAKAGVQGMSTRKHGEALQRGGDGGLQMLCQCLYLGGTGIGPPADKQAWLFRILQQLHGGVDLAGRGGCRQGGRLPAWQLAEFYREHLHIHRKLNKHRAGLAASGYPIGLKNGADDVFGPFNFVGCLGDAGHELVQVHGVQLELPVNVGADTATNHQHGDAVQKRLADAAGRMGETRCRHGHQGADRF